MNFEKWNKKTDLQGLIDDIEEAKNNSENRTYKEVPTGTYEVSIDKLEMTETKKGDPMVTCWFTVLEGEYKNSKIFMNQVINLGFQIHIVNEFLRSLGSSQDIEFEDYKQYYDLILDVAEEVIDNYEFLLNYGTTEKGFPTFSIAEVYEVE